MQTLNFGSRISEIGFKEIISPRETLKNTNSVLQIFRVFLVFHGYNNFNVQIKKILLAFFTCIS